ncbi:hypothetical protein [Enterococcus faecalis]|uniref:hypothetical protein n=1 Tax=Enterococcus faecalis TaxID=1351 RepID=UPI0002D29528|nr:hypothetical protein [Enterococcus faecalis]
MDQQTYINMLQDVIQIKSENGNNVRTIPEYDNAIVMATVEAVLDELNQTKGVDLEAVITATNRQ